jgi:hypothetical protein
MYNSYLEQIYSYQNSVSKINNPPFLADIFMPLDQLKKEFSRYIESIKT